MALTPRVARRYRDLFDGVPIGLYRISPQWEILAANPALAKMLLYPNQESLCSVSAIDVYLEQEQLERWAALVEQEGVVPGYEVQLRRRDGETIWAESNARVVRESGSSRVLYYEGSMENITARKKAEEQLHHNAFNDALTDLPNRALFKDHLKLAIERAKRHPGYFVAVMFLDLDRFKVINDSLGHEAGDNLLISVAQRLTAVLRPEDTIARLGGDEFAMLLDGIESLSGAIHIAERIEQELSAPFTLGNRQVFTSASIGIALSRDGSDLPEELMRNADTAMYRAKGRGEGRHAVFDQEMHARAMELLQIETDLHRAMDEEQFCLHYQPIISLKTDDIIGFEALVRWQHPERGLLSPNEFIPIAEETGMIVPIGRWVLREACCQLRQWQKKCRTSRFLSISVNLSSKQFMQPGFVEQVSDILQECSLAPRSLKLEITESIVMQYSDPAASILHQLKEVGVDLVIDDFGTGYSSLSYLHRLPIKGLKVDRSFIAHLNAGDGSRVIVRSVVMLANNLGMDVVAEGVEQKAQVKYLRALKCGYGQGYYFSKPLDCTAAGSLIQRPLH
jgi:diguanylate cyclase (GGDEF)-like protein/PAS domain S-box-containing protein